VHDLAVRRALGAGRARLVRAQMAEALLVAAGGGIGGALVAWATVPVLVRLAPDAIAGGFLSPPIPGLANAELDLKALAFAAAASLLAACVFGLLPAVHFSAAALGNLRKGTPTVVRRRSAARDALVVLQTASALVLLVGSTLLARSFWQLNRVDPGYRTEDILTFQISPERGDFTGTYGRASISSFHHAFMDRLEALPGVESTGYVTHLPLDEGAFQGFFTTQEIAASGREAPRLRVVGVGGDYFPTMGIELLSGRFFELADEHEFTLNVVLSLAAAELLFPGRDAVGQQFQEVELLGSFGPGTTYNVIGVVEDVLLDDFRRDAPEPIAFMAMPVLSPTFVVRSERVDQLVSEVREVIRDVSPHSPMFRVLTMKRLAANTMASLSFTMLMVGIAAAVAIVLGAVGIYGVVSYIVTRQTREIAVRMALGEERHRIRRMVVLRGARVALVGIGIGALTALGTSRLLESLLFGVQPIDPSTFVAMSILTLAIALLASYLPALRASAVDPMDSLRAD
jgi:predicted permease